MTEPKVIRGSVRMAKASERDMDAGYDLMNVLTDLDRGYYPALPDDRKPDDPTWFDEDDHAHLQHLHRVLKTLIDRAPGFMGRVMGGMSCFLNPKNAVIDPEADTIEFHPGLRRHVQWKPFDPATMSEGNWWVWTGDGIPSEWEWADGAWHYPTTSPSLIKGPRRPDLVALMVHPFLGPPEPPEQSAPPLAKGAAAV